MTQTLTPANNWDNVVLPVGGEARTIGSLIPGFQALLDRTYALREGLVAITVDGGEFTPTLPIIISGVGEKFTIGDDVDGTEMHLAPAAQFITESGSNVITYGSVAISGTSFTTSIPMVCSADGRVRLRYDSVDSAATPKTLGIDTSASADYTGDVIVVPAALLGGDVVYSISNTGANIGDVMHVLNLDAANTATVGGVALKNTAGSIRSCMFVYSGASWVPVHECYVDS